MVFAALCETVDGIWPNAASLAGGNWFKLNYYSGLPGRILPKLAGNYDLIYLEELPPGSPAARKHFTREAWRKLNPATGVLILPAAARGDLPPGAVRVLPVPGSRGELLAASPDAALTADPGKTGPAHGKTAGRFRPRRRFHAARDLRGTVHGGGVRCSGLARGSP